MAKIHAIGGYSEVGRNMTVVETKDDAFIFDCGIYLTPIVEIEENEHIYHERGLRAIGAIPDDYVLDKLNLRKKVRAILPNHAHLDHIGAIPYIGYGYKAPVISTPYTIEVLKALCRDAEIKLPNKLEVVKPNTSFKIGKYKVEFINATHSTLHTVMIALHTPEGVIVYANDWKFDDTPVIGLPPNYKRLKELGERKEVLALIVDSLYSKYDRKTPSEKIAKDMLEEVLTKTSNEKCGIIVTTFSSQIARIKSIIEFGKRIGRKVLIVGRSMGKYIGAANEINLAPFTKNIEIVTYRNQIKRRLKQISKEKEKWLVLCTGNQGEPGSILTRIASGDLPYDLKQGDQVIFSSKTIPTAITIANREKLEKSLKFKGARIFTDVHTSGHCSREDIRELINLLKPKHVIPSHGDIARLTPAAELGKEMGYQLGKNIHLMQNGESVELN
ncbi:RNase J family beta-CASP ribonuclease [Nanoarchaeota archaeon]